MKNPAKNKDNKELQDLLKAKRKEYAEFSKEVFQGNTKNVKGGRNLRKEIAQILTALNAKENASSDKK